jgi:hypothetical protein
MGSANLRLSRRQVLGIAAGGVVGAVGFRYLTLQLPGGSQQVASAAGSAGAWTSPLSNATGLAAHLPLFAPGTGTWRPRPRNFPSG